MVAVSGLHICMEFIMQSLCGTDYCSPIEAKDCIWLVCSGDCYMA